MELVEKPLKILPLGLLSYLMYAVYACPCKELLSCKKVSTSVVLVILGAMVILGYPLQF